MRANELNDEQTRVVMVAAAHQARYQRGVDRITRRHFRDDEELAGEITCRMLANFNFDPTRGSTFGTYAIKLARWVGGIVKTHIAHPKRGGDVVTLAEGDRAPDAALLHHRVAMHAGFAQVDDREEAERLLRRTSARCGRVVRLRADGYGFREIAEQLGVTRERARQLYLDAQADVSRRDKVTTAAQRVRRRATAK